MRSLRSISWLVVSSLLGVASLAAADEPSAEGIELFEKKIRPVLVQHCYACHSREADELGGGLSLESRAAILKGGSLGPALIPGEPENSLLLRAIRHQDKDLQMPPEEKLPPEVIADFEAWIKRGAPDPRNDPAAAPAGKYVVDIDAARHEWPYTPVVDRPLPKVRDTAWPRRGVDYFILEKLEARGVPPAVDADKRALIRRVTFDLIGMAPTVEEVEAFVADDAPDAFEKVVNRLLASPHYGERWGRHWLDVVRYADTAGDNSDFPIPQMVKYRDWVIRAFNNDLPYDQFLRAQVAGDLLPASSDEEHFQLTIATGYLASARRFGSTVSDYPQHLTIEDTIDNLGKAFLGLSLNCARCHNHKFDPITTEDYYGLYGIFHSTRYPWPGIELDRKQRDLVPLVPAEVVAKANDERKRQLEELQRRVSEAEQNKKKTDKQVNERKKQLDAARAGGEAKREEAAQAEKQLAAAEEQRKRVEQALNRAREEKERLENSPPAYDMAYAVAEGKTIENVRVQIKGDPNRLGPEVPRRFPVVFGGEALPADESGSGRKQLADWLARKDHPLTARVISNRLWHYHFGKGIVPTPNDFGRQGKPPSHPELLDYLASRLVENDWSLKELHREIVLSRTYQLSSHASEKSRELDPANDLFGHYPSRRLDAEAIRDTMLALGGNLDTTPGEPHPFPPQHAWHFTQHDPFKAVYESNRRSVYLMTQRIQRHPYLAIFDGPDTGASTGFRTVSTTTLQALYLLNDAFVHTQGAGFARRAMQLHDEEAKRIDWMFRAALARPADPSEQAACSAHLAKVREANRASGAAENDQERQAWESLARVLLRSNEFVYVE